ncbi:MAG: putative quinol monooxygenase [Bacillota bacterium]|nr:putative quinol monooxygenase [Bacillota bacterium]MDW7677260.1 putative quinol monooxygenase [Bacillota bacterium]
MITIVAKSVLKEGKVEDFKVITRELIEESRKEAGCISYNLYQDVKNHKILTFIEEWEDLEAIELHNVSEHFTRIVPQLSELREGPSEVNLYQLSD